MAIDAAWTAANEPRAGALVLEEVLQRMTQLVQRAALQSTTAPSADLSSATPLSTEPMAPPSTPLPATEPVPPVPEQNATVFLYGFCLVLIPTATILGNLLVIISVLRFKALHSAINFLILGLAVADLFVALFVMPYAVYVYIQGGYWFLGPLMCDIYSASDVACSTASIFLLAVISFDRYRAVSKPIQYSRQSQNIRRVVLILVVIWMVSLLLASPIVLGVNYRPADASPYECRFYNPEFSIGSSIVSFVIPCFIVLFVYIRIMMALRKRERAAKLRRLANQQESAKTGCNDEDADVGQIVAAPAVNVLMLALPSMQRRMRRFERHRNALQEAGELFKRQAWTRAAGGGGGGGGAAPRRRRHSHAPPPPPAAATNNGTRRGVPCGAPAADAGGATKAVAAAAGGRRGPDLGPAGALLQMAEMSTTVGVATLDPEAAVIEHSLRRCRFAADHRVCEYEKDVEEEEEEDEEELEEDEEEDEEDEDEDESESDSSLDERRGAARHLLARVGCGVANVSRLTDAAISVIGAKPRLSLAEPSLRRLLPSSVRRAPDARRKQGVVGQQRLNSVTPQTLGLSSLMPLLATGSFRRCSDSISQMRTFSCRLPGNNNLAPASLEEAQTPLRPASASPTGLKPNTFNQSPSISASNGFGLFLSDRPDVEVVDEDIEVANLVEIFGQTEDELPETVDEQPVGRISENPADDFCDRPLFAEVDDTNNSTMYKETSSTYRESQMRISQSDVEQVLRIESQPARDLDSLRNGDPSDPCIHYIRIQPPSPVAKDGFHFSANDPNTDVVIRFQELEPAAHAVTDQRERICVQVARSRRLRAETLIASRGISSAPDAQVAADMRTNADMAESDENKMFKSVDKSNRDHAVKRNQNELFEEKVGFQPLEPPVTFNATKTVVLKGIDSQKEGYQNEVSVKADFDIYKLHEDLTLDNPIDENVLNVIFEDKWSFHEIELSKSETNMSSIVIHGRIAVRENGKVLAKTGVTRTVNYSEVTEVTDNAELLDEKGFESDGSKAMNTVEYDEDIQQMVDLKRATTPSPERSRRSSLESRTTRHNRERIWAARERFFSLSPASPLMLRRFVCDPVNDLPPALRQPSVDAGPAPPHEQDLGNSSSPLSSSDSLSENMNVGPNDFASEAPTSMSRKSSDYDVNHDYINDRTCHAISDKSQKDRSPLRRIKSLHVNHRGISVPRATQILRNFSRRSPRIFRSTDDNLRSRNKFRLAEEAAFEAASPLLRDQTRSDSVSNLHADAQENTEDGLHKTDASEKTADELLAFSAPRRFEGALTSAALGEELDYADVDSLKRSQDGTNMQFIFVNDHTTPDRPFVDQTSERRMHESTGPSNLMVVSTVEEEPSQANEPTIATDSGVAELSSGVREVSVAENGECAENNWDSGSRKFGSPTVTFKIPGKRYDKTRQSSPSSNGRPGNRPMKRLFSAAQIYENRKTVEETTPDSDYDGSRHRRSLSQRLRGSLGTAIGPINSRSDHSLDSFYSSTPSQATNTPSTGKAEPKRARPTTGTRANGSTTELAVRMVKKAMNRKESSLKRKVNKAQRKEKRATKTLGIVVGIFLVCWVPFFGINILNAVCIKLNAPGCQVGFGPFFYATWIGYMNSFMNPVIYTIFNTEFRRAFKSLILGKNASRRTRARHV